MKMNAKKLVKGFTLVELLVVIAIIAALAALATPVVLKQQKKAAATTALNNAKQIYLLLFEYDEDNNTYPAEGTSSNLNFAKLIEDGYTTSEEIFYSKTAITGFVKPDNDISTGNAVAANECGFLYVEGYGTGSVASAPLVAAPPANKTDDTLDENVFGDKAVLLRNDGGVRTLKLDGSGALIEAGSDILGTATGTVLPPA